MKKLKQLTDELKKSTNLDFYFTRPKTTEKRPTPFIIIDEDFDNSFQNGDDSWLMRSTTLILKLVTSNKLSIQKNILTKKLENIKQNYSILGSFKDKQSGNWITDYEINIVYSKTEFTKGD